MTTPLSRDTHIKRNRFPEPVDNRSFICSLPAEVCLKIFSNLDLTTTVDVYLTCKSWNKFAIKFKLFNLYVYEQIAFSIDKWIECGGEEIVKGESRKNEMSTLPAHEFFISCQRVNKIFHKVRAEDCLMLVWIPNALTLNKLVALTKTFFSSDNHVHIEPAILQQLGNLKIKRSHWLIMTKDVLPESLNKDYNSQRRIINDWNQKIGARYCIPKIIEIAIGYFAQILDPKISPSNNSTYYYAMGRENYTIPYPSPRMGNVIYQRHIGVAIDNSQNKCIHFDSLLVDTHQRNFGITLCRRF